MADRIGDIIAGADRRADPDPHGPPVFPPRADTFAFFTIPLRARVPDDRAARDAAIAVPAITTMTSQADTAPRARRAPLSTRR